MNKQWKKRQKNIFSIINSFYKQFPIAIETISVDFLVIFYGNQLESDSVVQQLFELSSMENTIFSFFSNSTHKCNTIVNLHEFHSFSLWEKKMIKTASSQANACTRLTRTPIRIENLYFDQKIAFCVCGLVTNTHYSVHDIMCTLFFLVLSPFYCRCCCCFGRYNRLYVYVVFFLSAFLLSMRFLYHPHIFHGS